MTNRSMVRVVLLFGLIPCVGAVLLYVYGGGFAGGFSSRQSDWGDFGSYFGGLLGPIMSFVTIVLLIMTLHQQMRAGIRERHFRYIETAYKDVQDLLQRPLETISGRDVFEGYVLGVANSPLDDTVRQRLVQELLVRTAHYAEAFAISRANVDPYLEFKAHAEKIGRLLKFLKEHKSDLEGMQEVTLGFIELHLRGKRET